MPASLPGSTIAQNQGNPTLGKLVTFDALSGPMALVVATVPATP